MNTHDAVTTAVLNTDSKLASVEVLAACLLVAAVPAASAAAAAVRHTPLQCLRGKEQIACLHSKYSIKVASFERAILPIDRTTSLHREGRPIVGKTPAPRKF